MSSEYATVTKGSVEKDTSYMFSRVWRISQIYNMLGLEYTKVVNMTRLHRFSVRCTLKIHSVLNVLSYAKVLNLSGVQVCYSEKGF